MEKKIELRVVEITSSQSQASAFAMVLQEVNGDRQLPVIIGPAEAQSISFKLNEIRSARPLTHDLFTSTLTVFGISLIEVLIYKAQDGVFFSYIFMKRGEEMVRIDARTSDAVALAIRFYCPIYVNENILEKESILAEQTGTRKKTQSDDIKENMKKKSIASLKKELTKAIEDENYELASILRDEIESRK